MAFPGAETMKAGAIGLEALRPCFPRRYLWPFGGGEVSLLELPLALLLLYPLAITGRLAPPLRVEESPAAIKEEGPRPEDRSR